MRSYPVLQQPLLCADWQAGFCVQDIAGTVSTMHMSPYADCLAIITEEDPSVISIFSWNLSTVIKDLEQFQTSIATGTGLVTNFDIAWNSSSLGIAHRLEQLIAWNSSTS
eukprot:scpid64315/ scgid0896/ 